MKGQNKIGRRKPVIGIICLLIVFVGIFAVWQYTKPVPTDGDWKDTLMRLSTAEITGDKVTVKNVRDFQYDAHLNPTVETYYDKTYDLNKLKKVWYVTVPFHPGSNFAHTFMSFEFSDGAFLAITIEARLTKSQEYTMSGGTLHTYPLMYIAADERDVVFFRTNILKDDVYVYPVRATPAQARILLVDMLQRMNELAVHPTWYNTELSNCTSNIADHINKLWPGLLPRLDWETLLTNHADELVLKKGLLDTDLALDAARQKFYVSSKAQKAGYTDTFSQQIRQD